MKTIPLIGSGFGALQLVPQWLASILVALIVMGVLFVYVTPSALTWVREFRRETTGRSSR